METITSDENQPATTGLDSPIVPQIDHHDDDHLELQSLRQSYETLQSKYSVMEENMLLVQQQRDEALEHNVNLKIVINETTRERDSLREQIRELEISFKQREDEFAKTIDRESSIKEELEKEVEVAKERNKELELRIKEAEAKNNFLLKTLDALRPVKDCLVGIIECFDEEEVIDRMNNDEGGVELELDSGSKAIWKEFTPITRLASDAKSKVFEFMERKKSEIRELENSVVSLTEENRDINSLLRVALLEKETVEKSLNKLKGNTEQRRVALLQIAERGLQKVGFGFMMGSGSTEQSGESSGANTNAIPAITTASTKSDSSECEEEVVSLVRVILHYPSFFFLVLE